MHEVAVVLLTWQRIASIRKTIQMLHNQTFRKFDVFISNGNLEASRLIDKHVALARRSGLNVFVSHDGNDIYSFRRFSVAKELAARGYKIILFLDDDILFPKNYIKECIDQYEPEAYISGYTWRFLNNGQDYYKMRTRVHNNEQRIHYCGAGVSMLDASIFLNDDLINSAPPEAYKIEDLWLSYYVDHVMKLPLRHMQIQGVKIGGSDNVALFKDIMDSPYNKAHFLRDLVNMGWDLSH